MPMHRTRRMATLSRSLRLLRAFSYEQFRPHIFYSMLARDTRSLIDALSHDLLDTPVTSTSVPVSYTHLTLPTTPYV